MPLTRVLEPEVMDSLAEAVDYDSMDHRAVNRAFVDDLLAAAAFWFHGGACESRVHVLDVGTGTAQIPIELCRRSAGFAVVGADLARHMLDLGRANIAASGLQNAIRLDLVDAKSLPYSSGEFDIVMSNSILHHIPEPVTALREMLRLVRPAGLLFVRDLFRPADEAAWDNLVGRYAGDANPHQRQMFRDSLRASLTVEEAAAMAASLGLSSDCVRATSDRHWTLSAPSRAS